jgi:hypothetical protein
MFRDNLSLPPSRVKLSKKNFRSIFCQNRNDVLVVQNQYRFSYRLIRILWIVQGVDFGRAHLQLDNELTLFAIMHVVNP